MGLSLAERNELHRRRKEAQHALSRAAAFSFELDEDSQVQALLLAAIGIMHLAASDPSGVVLDRALAVIAKVKENEG